VKIPSENARITMISHYSRVKDIKYIGEKRMLDMIEKIKIISHV